MWKKFLLWDGWCPWFGHKWEINLRWSDVNAGDPYSSWLGEFDCRRCGHQVAKWHDAIMRPE